MSRVSAPSSAFQARPRSSIRRSTSWPRPRASTVLPCSTASAAARQPPCSLRSTAPRLATPLCLSRRPSCCSGRVWLSPLPGPVRSESRRFRAGQNLPMTKAAFGRPLFLYRICAELVAPALQIRPSRSVFLHLRDELLCHLRAARTPAVRCQRLKHNLAGPLRIVGFLDEVVEHVHAHVQEVAVGVANIDIDLVGQLRAERRPVGLHDVAQVVMLFPVRGDLLVNLAGLLVPDRNRIAVVADGTVRRFPDV